MGFSPGPSKIIPFSSTIILPMLINFYALKKKKLHLNDGSYALEIFLEVLSKT